MVFASDSTPEVPGFADPLGDRVIVPQPSGSLLEFLHFRADLASAPFFEPAVKDRLTRLTNFRHSSYTRARRLQRGEDRGLALVSTHVPGRRLSEILQIAARSGSCPPLPAVLALTRQLMTAVALMHDYGPDIFHGTVGPERLILPGDGRVVLCEYVLGTGFEQAVPVWGVNVLWRERRVAMLNDTSLQRYGRHVDLLQIGLVVLACLLGRPLGAGEYPDGVGELLGLAQETSIEGDRSPLGKELASWLTRMLGLPPARPFRTLVEAQKELGALVQQGGRYEASPSALQSFVARCESAWSPEAPACIEPGDSSPAHATLTSAADMLEAVAKRGEESRAEPIPPGGWWSEPKDQPTALEQVTALDRAAAGDAEAPDQAWFTPDVPAFSLAPDPLLTGLLGADTQARSQAETPLDPVQAGEPGPPEPEPTDGAELSSPARTAEAATWSPVAAADPSAAATPQAAVPRAVPDAGAGEDWQQPAEAAESRRKRAPKASASAATAATRAPLSPRRLPSWRMLAAGACAVVVIAVGAIVAPRALSRAIAGPPMGQLAVESEPSGASILLDGKEAGRTPATLTVPPGQHHLEVRSGGSSRSAWVTVSEVEPLTHRVSMPEAALRAALTIQTNPPGGTITVDGTDRGKAPVSLSDLVPGAHRVVAVGPFGPVEEHLTVEGGTTSTVTVATVGWVKIRAPYPLEVSERGQVFGQTSGQALMVPAGRHHFDLVNADLALRVRQFVDVPAGSVVNVPFEPPMGMMNLSSDEPADVWLDGAFIGQTPLTTLPVPLGSHQVVFRHPALGEVSYSVNVSLAAPVRLTVTFKKKQLP